MGNTIDIKLKNKIKIDLKPKNACPYPLGSDSNTSIVSEKSICYDFKESTDNESVSETESCFIERELNKFESDEEEIEDKINDNNSKEINSDQSNLNQIVNLDANPKTSTNGSTPNDKILEIQMKNEQSEYKTPGTNKIKTIPFKNQDINEIRKKGVAFVDEVFKANVMALTNNPHSEFGKQLIQGTRCRSYDLRELNSKILWKKPQVSKLLNHK